VEADSVMDQESVISIHSTLTALSVAVGRLDEQMKSMRGELLHHTKNEHKAFDETLVIVSEIKDDVAKLQSLIDQSKGAWWLLAKLGAVIFALAGLIGWAVTTFFHPR